MEPEEARQRGKALDDMLKRASSNWESSLSGFDPGAKWTILNKLVYLLGGTDPTVALAAYSEGENVARILIFTDSYLLFGEGDPKNLSFKVVPRCNLEGVELLTADTVFANEWSKETHTDVVLRYKHNIEINLPLGDGTTYAAKQDVDSLVPHFVNELVRNAS